MNADVRVYTPPSGKAPDATPTTLLNTNEDIIALGALDAAFARYPARVQLLLVVDATIDERRFRDAVAALYEKKRLDAPPPCRDAVRDFVVTKAEALTQYKNGRLDKAVDAMRHLKTTEWTLRLGDVQGPIGAPRNEPMVRTRSKLPGIITPEVNSDLYVWTPTPSSAESAAECECFLEAMKRSILQRLAVEPRGAARRILRPGPQVLSPEDPLPSRGLP